MSRTTATPINKKPSKEDGVELDNLRKKKAAGTNSSTSEEDNTPPTTLASKQKTPSKSTESDDQQQATIHLFNQVCPDSSRPYR